MLKRKSLEKRQAGMRVREAAKERKGRPVGPPAELRQLRREMYYLLVDPGGHSPEIVARLMKKRHPDQRFWAAIKFWCARPSE